jgi:hypothetical protein
MAAIYGNTTGVIFLGTPHRGSEKRAYGEILSKIAKLTLRRPNAQLLRVLWRDSDAIERQRHEFTTVSKSMLIFCIREELNTAIGMVSASHSCIRETRSFDSNTTHDC